MPKIRVPKHLTANFKSFCKRFSLALENSTGLRLRGNKLLNVMALAAGHDNYKALLIDAGTYGKGRFDWDALPTALAGPLAEQLGVPAKQLWMPLSSAVLSEPEAISEIHEKLKHSHNPFAGARLKGLSLPARDASFSDLFSNNLSEIELTSLIKEQDNPVLDLSVINSLDNVEDRISLLNVIGQQFLDMDDDCRKRVVFLGDRREVELFLQANIAAFDVLQQNPSIREHGITQVFARSDLSSLEASSPEEAEAVLGNVKMRFILDEYPMPRADEGLTRTLDRARSPRSVDRDALSIGERFAGQTCPPELRDSRSEIEAKIETVKLEVMPIMPKVYDLQTFATVLYGELNNTNGFTSLDLAGWLLDHGRSLDLGLSHS